MLVIMSKDRYFLLLHINIDDIVFGATIYDLCKEFEMSYVEELTFFFGLLIK